MNEITATYPCGQTGAKLSLLRRKFLCYGIGKETYSKPRSLPFFWVTAAFKSEPCADGRLSDLDIQSKVIECQQVKSKGHISPRLRRVVNLHPPER
jgi:hypothetical protein